MREPGLRLVGQRRLVGRALPRVADAQGRGDDRHLPDALFAVRLEEHPGDPGVERAWGPSGGRAA